MKRIMSLSLALIFFFIHGSGFAQFNMFQQRRIVIGSFENRGDVLYDYLGNSLKTVLYSSSCTIPFITLTDEERAFLEKLSTQEEFAEKNEALPCTIGYRMEPSFSLEEPVTEEFPLIIHGSYRVVLKKKAAAPETDARGEKNQKPPVLPEKTGTSDLPGETAPIGQEPSSEETLLMNIVVTNSMLGSSHRSFDLEADLTAFLNDPSAALSPFFQWFLKYKTYRCTITAQPKDALIFLNSKLAGTGTAANILVTPGSHRITATREGFEDYSDLVRIDEDGWAEHITLQKKTKGNFYRISAIPPGTDIYIGEKWIGSAPTTFFADRDDLTVTLIKEGYRTQVLTMANTPDKSRVIVVTLEKPENRIQYSEKAELHKKHAKLLSWTGFGMLGLVIFFGMEKTLNLQKADLYEEVNKEKYDKACRLSSVYNILTISSSVLTGGIFTFSFIHTLKYFNLYNPGQSGTGSGVPILKKEVAF